MEFRDRVASSNFCIGNFNSFTNQSFGCKAKNNFHAAR